MQTVITLTDVDMDYETRCDSTETIFFLGTWEKSFEILRTAFANYI